MEEYNKYSFDSDYARERSGLTLNQYVVRTFLWMFLGLMVTFGTAYFGYVSKLIGYVYLIPYWHIILLVAELAVVLVLAARIDRLAVGTARVLFLAYAVLNGIVFSAYFLIYEMASLIFIFVLTAVYFGVFALYGRFTKRDLSGLRPILISGLIFLVVVGVLSFFIPMGNLERIICLIAIAVFLGFTAYDTQKIKAYYAHFSGDEAMLQKASIYSALQLYLDFINLFLYLLRFMGKHKN